MLAIDKYYPNLSARACDRWIYQSGETIIEDNDLSAKIEFLALREDLTSREEFQQMSMPCFWINRMTDYPVILVQALRYLIQIPSTNKNTPHIEYTCFNFIGSKIVGF